MESWTSGAGPRRWRHLRRPPGWLEGAFEGAIARPSVRPRTKASPRRFWTGTSWRERPAPPSCGPPWITRCHREALTVYGQGASDDLRLTEGGKLGPVGPTPEACAPPVRRPHRQLIPGLQETGAASPPLGKESGRCMPYAASVDTMGVAPPAGPAFRGLHQAGIIATPGGIERRHLAGPAHRARRTAASGVDKSIT